MASKVSVFRKVKEIHARLGGATPQILVSMITRELSIDAEEATRHLDALRELQLVKYKGTKKGAVELTKVGITTNLSPAPVTPQPVTTPEEGAPAGTPGDPGE